jgi:hypothetical protein
MRKIALVGLTLLILATLCPPGQAYEPLGSDGEWDFVLTPYVWIPARSDITSTVNGQSVGAEDVSFKTIADMFDVFALSGRMEAWKGRFGLIGDAMWIKLNTSDKTVPLPGPVLDISIDKVDIQQVVFDVAGAYRLLQRPLRQGRALPALYFESFLGARVVYLKQKIDVTIEPQGPILPGRSPTLGDEKTWAELMIGGRLWMQVLEKLSFALRGSVSGFGIGEGSDLQWDFLAGADYRPWRRASFKAGYRVYHIDYMTGSGRDAFGYNTSQHGPYLGVSIHF